MKGCKKKNGPFYSLKNCEQSLIKLKLLVILMLFFLTVLTGPASADNLSALSSTSKRPYHLRLGAAPDNSYQLLTSEILKSNSSLYINVYELSHPGIVDAIIDRASKGVKVKIILEGSPVGGFKRDSRIAVKRLYNLFKHLPGNQLKIMYNVDRLVANEESYEYIDNDKKNIGAVSRPKGRKYRFDHAKYTIIDNKSIVIGSENYGMHGHPPSNKDAGNRGWEIATTDSKIIQQFKNIFEEDFAGKDLLDMNNPHFKKLFLPPNNRNATEDATENTSEDSDLNLIKINANLDDNEAGIKYSDASSIKEIKEGECGIKAVTSPDNSEDELIKLIKEAKKSIDLELMSFNPRWTVNREGIQSPLLSAIETALKKKVKVWIILNSPDSFYTVKRNSSTHKLFSYDIFSFLKFTDNSSNNSTDNLLNNNTGSSSDHSYSASFSNKKRKPRSNAGVTNDNWGVYKQLQKLKSQGLPINIIFGNNRKMEISYIHNKGVIIDDEITLISSINWTQTSITRNREAAVEISCPVAANYYSQLFWRDWNRSCSEEDSEDN